MPEQAENNHRHNPLMKPLAVLATPGIYLFYKYNQYKRKRKENANRRMAERELQHLNTKIEKLLSKLEESEPDLATCREEECVICIHAKATMQTSPCDHQVVCRKCFVKTIQIAVSQRLLPLRCVVCRAKILRLKTGPVFPSSVSGYSMTSRDSSVPPSDSFYSVSSGASTISSTSSNYSDVKAKKCCGGRCIGGAHPRQPPSTGTIRRSQKERPEKKTHINRLPPIKEASPLHNVPPPSTRIRCAQKIVTQLEMPFFRPKYERLSQEDLDEEYVEKRRKWWTRSEEKIDNKKNEITEKRIRERISMRLLNKDDDEIEISFKSEQL